jgi:signal transduction histidine kinase
MVTAAADTGARGATPVALATMAALVFGTAVAGIDLTACTGRIAAIWIANAILVSYLLKHPRADWAKLFAVGLAANLAADLVSGDGLTRGLVLSLSNAIEIFIVVVPLRLWKLDRNFARPQSLLIFYALAAGPAPFAGALVSAIYFHLADGTDVWSSLSPWYAADALGLVIVVPMLMTVRTDAFKAMFGRDQIFVTMLLLGAVVAAAALNHFTGYPLAFLFFGSVLLLTFQRGFAGGAVGLLLAGSYLMVPVLLGYGNGGLRGHSLREQIVIVQVFATVIGFSVVLVGAALEERRRLERGLASAIDRAERAREEALVACDASEKANRAKSMFLANMSHELRTPLNAVIGLAEIMHAQMFGPLGDTRYREYTELIQDAGRHLLDLINDILDMSKIEAGKHELQRERIAVGPLVRDCVDLMRERATQAELELVADLDTAPAWIEADRRALKQILLNLLSNAIKFTPAGGRVSVAAKVARGMLVLSVADTGIGIPGDQLYRLGNPFVQLRNNAGATQLGTGLGLALVRALAGLHPGTLKIESAEGRGTTASVEIPLDEAASLAA